jgi:hypothetical protein
VTLEDDDEVEKDWDEFERDIKDGKLLECSGVEVEDEINIKEIHLKNVPIEYKRVFSVYLVRWMISWAILASTTRSW